MMGKEETSMRNPEYYTKVRITWLLLFIGVSIIHFINLFIPTFSDHGFTWIPIIVTFFAFLTDWNPIQSCINYGKRHPIVAEGDIIHLCLEQYGEIRPYYVRDMVINRGYVENYNTKCPDYISLTPITLENAGLFTKGKRSIINISSKQEQSK